jgi:hypothetical protein
MDWNKVDLVRWYKALRIIAINSWRESKLHKLKMVVTVALLLYCLLWYIGVPIPTEVGFGIVFANGVLQFWPDARGRLFGPILKHTMTLVEIDDRNQIVTPYKYDESWKFFERTPDLAAWCRENCQGFVGVLPKRPNDDKENHRVFWFSRKDDAFAFKMRWS